MRVSAHRIATSVDHQPQAAELVDVVAQDAAGLVVLVVVERVAVVGDLELAVAALGRAQQIRVGALAGTRQVTYNGHPLYYFTGDRNPGETRGQGLDRFGGPWYVVAPAGDKIDPDDAEPAPAASSGGYGY